MKTSVDGIAAVAKIEKKNNKKQPLCLLIMLVHTNTTVGELNKCIANLLAWNVELA